MLVIRAADVPLAQMQVTRRFTAVFGFMKRRTFPKVICTLARSLVRRSDDLDGRPYEHAVIV